MVVLTPDRFSRIIAYIAVFFGAAALVLACVGLGTARWNSYYGTTDGVNYVKGGSANFFYTCPSYSNGTTINCTNRDYTLYGYNNYNPLYMTDYYQRMQNAGAMCIVGIIFLFLGTLVTLITASVYFERKATVVLIGPVLLFLACLFMLAGMAEGSRYLTYNDYSANLYQAGHLLTMFTLFLSSIAAGRMHFSITTRAGQNTV